MNRVSLVAVAAIALVSAPASSLRAQSLDDRVVQVGLMGGLTSAAGNLSTPTTHAGNAGALVTVGAPSSHLRFRLDAQWQQLSGKSYGGALECPGCVGTFRHRNYRVLDATANAVLQGTLAAPVSVYVIGGVGVYGVRGTTVIRQGDLVASGSSSATRFGLNGGVGTSVRVGNIATFFEVRFHQLVGHISYSSSDGYYDGGPPGAFQFVPISVGVVF
jgi:opacity protein-like surface antigen